jgi:hypothetical protein
MSPAELAREAPRLFHLTTPGASASILAHGLCCAASLVRDSTLAAERRRALLNERRAKEVPLTLQDGRSIRLNDNLPLSLKALQTCLHDGWSPADWIAHLNQHVFLWPSEKQLQKLLNARMNREREREVLVFDTSSLVAAHAERVCLSPINSGATVRNAPGRGAATFTPINAGAFAQWRRLRGMRSPDNIAEVVVRGDVQDAAQHLIELRRYRGTERLA